MQFVRFWGKADINYAPSCARLPRPFQTSCFPDPSDLEGFTRAGPASNQRLPCAAGCSQAQGPSCASPARSSARRTPGATDNTSPRSPQSGGLRPPCSGPARPEHRPAAASRRSLQACIPSLPLQSSSTSQPYLKSDHCNGGGSLRNDARQSQLPTQRSVETENSAFQPEAQRPVRISIENCVNKDGSRPRKTRQCRVFGKIQGGKRGNRV